MLGQWEFDGFVHLGIHHGSMGKFADWWKPAKPLSHECSRFYVHCDLLFEMIQTLTFNMCTMHSAFFLISQKALHIRNEMGRKSLYSNAKEKKQAKAEWYEQTKLNEEK